MQRKITVTTNLGRADIDIDVYYTKHKAEFNEPAHFEITDLQYSGKCVTNLLGFEPFLNFLLSEIEDEHKSN